MELNLEKPILFFDIESTGLNIASDSIIELSFVKILPGNEVRVKTWRVKPWDYAANCQKKINPSAMEVHKISDEDLVGEKTFLEIVDEVQDWLDGCDLAGFNSNKFDLPMLAEELERVRKFRNKAVRIDLHKMRMVDVQNIYHQLEPRNLKAAYKFYCGKELENMRNAERDCHLEVKSKTDKINEIEYVNSVLKYENHGLRSHISFMESKCASLENEIGALKNSRAFRWMRRYCDFTGSIVQGTCRFLYRFLKAVDRLLPLRYHTREQLKLWVYGHFGAAFRNMKNYQEFMRQQELKKYLCPDADTGPRIPGAMPLTSVMSPVSTTLKLTVKCLNSI